LAGITGLELPKGLAMPDDPTRKAVRTAASEPDPVSPCLGICLMDPATRTCRFCLRTIAEITGWYRAAPAEKRAILERLPARHAAAKARQ
jgi:predicted Fe-S protein YdhL (DUF1289 family)